MLHITLEVMLHITLEVMSSCGVMYLDFRELGLPHILIFLINTFNINRQYLIQHIGEKFVGQYFLSNNL